MDNKLILIIDNDEAQTETLTTLFTKQGYQVKTATNGLEGMALWQMVRPDLVISALDLPKANGLDILDFRNTEFQHIPLLLLTEAADTWKAAVTVLQGAHDYFVRPINPEYVLESAEQALSLRRKQGALCQADALPNDTLIGSSSFMKSLKKDLALVSSTSSDILITGEAGTGKSLLVRHIHKQSSTSKTPCICIDCAAQGEKELEDILFRNGLEQHPKDPRGNAFYLSEGGLLYLREVTALSMALQTRLFHTLETGTLLLSSPESVQNIQTKIIASSSKDLETMVNNGLFHAGLHARLKTFHFALQPLRRRGKDLFELIDYFLDNFSKKHDRISPPFSGQALKLFLRYPWPGNVGELRDILERLILTCEADTITDKALPQKMRKRGGTKAKPVKLPSLPGEEKLHIIATLEEAGWNQSESARRLGITRNTLRYRMKKYNIKARPRQSSHA